MGRPSRDYLSHAPLLALLWACGGSGGTSPPPPAPPPPPPAPVASVVVTPSQATIEVGATVQLTAQPRDAVGNNLNRAVTWQSQTPALASVNTSGLVTGVAPGNATIVATSEGAAGNATIEVRAPPPVVINQVNPAVLTEGQPATITGSGFSATAANNVVRVGGVAAAVTQATTTTLQVTVPTGLCLPAGDPVPVAVTVGTVASNPFPHPLQPATPLALAVGELAVVQSPAARCVHFAPIQGAERYVVGVQSVSAVAATISALTVDGRIPGAAPPAPPLPPVSLASAPAGPAPSPADLAAEARWQSHLAATAAQYERERIQLEGIRRQGEGPRLAPPVAFAPSVPGTVVEGQTVPIRVVRVGGTGCNDFATINAKVRRITPQAIFVEDEANPVTLDDAVFDEAGTAFGPIHDLSIEHFGPVGDLDQNQRLVIVVTRQVNLIPNGPLGFVAQGNLFLVAQCAYSNEGEYFFMRAADPAGTLAVGVYTVADLVRNFPLLLLHEFAHNIQGHRRMAVGGQFMASYVAEGLATAAQEVIGFLILGLQQGQNYGRNQVYASFGADPRGFFTFVSGDHAAYFGHNFQNGRIGAAPEECTWVGGASTTGGNPGPCAFSSRLSYGVPWGLIKHALDRHLGGPAGQKQVFKAFNDHPGPTGFAELEAILGRPAATLLAEWAPMLYLDDRYPAAAQFQKANWNLRNVVGAWGVNADLLARLRGFESFADNLSVRAGSSAYYEVSGANRPATVFRVRDQAGNAPPAIIQIWVVRVQ